MLRGRIHRMKRKVKQDDELITSDFYTGSDAGWCADRCSADNG